MDLSYCVNPCLQVYKARLWSKCYFLLSEVVSFGKPILCVNLIQRGWWLFQQIIFTTCTVNSPWSRVKVWWANSPWSQRVLWGGTSLYVSSTCPPQNLQLKQFLNNSRKRKVSTGNWINSTKHCKSNLPLSWLWTIHKLLKFLISLAKSLNSSSSVQWNHLKLFSKPVEHLSSKCFRLVGYPYCWAQLKFIMLLVVSIVI